MSDIEVLYEHRENPHILRDPREHVEEKKKGSWYSRAKAWLAVRITNAVGSMECAFIFACWALYGFPYQNPTPATIVPWVSQTFLQLVLLSIIMVGQAVLSRVTEEIIKTIYNLVKHILHDSEQMKNHMHAQDKELIKQSQDIEDLQTQLAGSHLVIQATLAEVQLLRKQLEERDKVFESRMFDQKQLVTQKRTSFLARFQKAGK